jgi:ArsR family transcriptional regulator
MMSATLTAPDLFRAFADATRLRILSLLLERELCVCELCDLLDEIQPKVSRHLAYLRRAGLVTVRSEGKWKHYAVARGAAGIRGRLLHCVGACLREMDVLQDDLDRLSAATRGNRCQS